MTPEQAVSVQLEEDAATLIFRLLEQTLNHQRKIMSALDDLNAKADAMNAQIVKNNADIEALIVLAKSKGATDDEIAAVTAKLDTGLQSLTTEDSSAETVTNPPA